MARSPEYEVEKGNSPRVTLKQWVVKGPGPGAKYMTRQCYPRKADWVTSQRKAARLNETEAETEARRFGGRPVKLVAARRLVRKVPALKHFLDRQSKGAPKKQVLRWIHGVGEMEECEYTEGDCFCTTCATKVVEELTQKHPELAEAVSLSVDGGWGSEEDGTRICEVCEVPLQHALTAYGAEEEFNHFRTYPPKLGRPSEWDAINLAVENLSDDSPLWLFVERWVRNAKRRTSGKRAST